jgi:hypothetical protein
MSERQKQIAFLKELLERRDTEQRWRLQEEIFKAEQNEKCVRSAMSGVGVIVLLCLCGLCYEAIFVTDFFQNPTHLLTRVFGYLGFGSAICWVVFLGCWFWYRALTNRLYADCRRLLVSLSEPRISIQSAKDCLTIGHDNVPNQDISVVSPPPEVPLSEAA